MRLIILCLIPQAFYKTLNGLTCDINLSQALHERDMYRTEHLITGQAGDYLGLGPFHH